MSDDTTPTAAVAGDPPAESTITSQPLQEQAPPATAQVPVSEMVAEATKIDEGGKPETAPPTEDKGKEKEAPQPKKEEPPPPPKMTDVEYERRYAQMKRDIENGEWSRPCPDIHQLLSSWLQ